MLRAVLHVLSIFLAGCSSASISVRSAPWPFQELEIGDRGGVRTAYYSRPDIEPKYLVVVIQDPPCMGDSVGGLRVSTSGILWKQLHADSAFLQFEPVDVHRFHSSPGPCSGLQSARSSYASWAGNIERAVTAIKRRERLLGLPTVYFGIGAGAPPAAAIASRDRNAVALAILNGVDLRSGRKLSKRLPILIAHAGSNNQAPLHSALLWFSELRSREHPTAMLLLEGLDHDLGLSSAPECFDAVVQQIVARLRGLTGDPPTVATGLEVSDCSTALQEFPEKAEN